MTTRFQHYNTPYQNIIYDDLLLVFCDVIFIFVIILQAKSLSLATYDEVGHFVIEEISFCDESKQRTSKTSLIITFLVVIGALFLVVLVASYVCAR